MVAEARQRVRELTPAEVVAARDRGVLLVDIREPDEREATEFIPGAVFAPRGCSSSGRTRPTRRTGRSSTRRRRSSSIAHRVAARPWRLRCSPIWGTATCPTWKAGSIAGSMTASPWSTNAGDEMPPGRDIPPGRGHPDRPTGTIPPPDATGDHRRVSRENARLGESLRVPGKGDARRQHEGRRILPAPPGDSGPGRGLRSEERRVGKEGRATWAP